MNPNAHLSPGEFELMEILWSIGEGSVKDVLDRIKPSRQLAYTTVMTVLDKLRRKGILRYRRRGKAYIYAPLVSRETVLEAVLDEFVGTYFDGSRDRLLDQVNPERTPKVKVGAGPVPVAGRDARAASKPEEELDEFLL